MLCSVCKCGEDLSSTFHLEQQPKRRRLFGKFHTDQILAPSEALPQPAAGPEMPLGEMFDPSPSGSNKSAVSQAVQMAEQCAPRLRKIVIQ
jgi:hypothetical protein